MDLQAGLINALTEAGYADVPAPNGFKFVVEIIEKFFQQTGDAVFFLELSEPPTETPEIKKVWIACTDYVVFVVPSEKLSDREANFRIYPKDELTVTDIAVHDWIGDGPVETSSVTINLTAPDGKVHLTARMYNCIALRAFARTLLGPRRKIAG